MGRGRIAALVVVAILAFPNASKGEDSSTRALTNRLVGSCVSFIKRHGKPPNLYEIMITRFDVETLIPQVEAVLDDDPYEFRRDMLDWLGMMGLGSQDPSTRQRVVNELLARFCEDETERGLVGLCAEHLRCFKAADFSQAARVLLSKRLAAGHSRRFVVNTTILLVGIADMKPEIPRLPAPPASTWRYDRYSRELPVWSAVRARARMGVREDIQRCIDFVSSQPDPKWRVACGFGELSYVAQPEVVEYLRAQLESEERFVPTGWEEAVLRTRGVKTASFAACVLHDMIRGFPVQKNFPLKYTDEDLARCREWMTRRRKYDIVKTRVPARIRPVRHRPAGAQADELEGRVVGKLLKTYVGCVRDHKRGQTEVFLARALGAGLLPHLEALREDPDETVRYFATSVLGAVCESLDVPSAKRRIVEALTKALGDRGGKWRPSSAASLNLLGMTSDDFSEAAKAELLRQFADRPSYPGLLTRLILIMGLADVRPGLSELGEIVSNEAAAPGGKEWWGSPGWAAMRARARSGVPEDIARCIELVEADPSRYSRLTMRFQDLAFVRRPEVVRLFVRYLKEDGEVASWGVTQSQYAAYYLGQMIRDFPVKKRSARSYSPEDIAVCRKWIAAQESFDIVGMWEPPPPVGARPLQ